ncbi:FGGY-family carbohydrate kinase [uncultured Arsenicicoccus sp.]|uniref:FGGY-family carbohydrate kinase n=1 Tax=uncultured Arsenicicoccus sp. TaxID=491339 RepID=UPI002597E45C|nr:FGGY family carbohydrate kinase [uncultured Arsenicicoccus sp.]
MSWSTGDATVTLGVDIGTGSAKGVLVTSDGRVVASERVELQMRMPRPDWAEMDAESDWWGSVVTICRRLADQLDGRELAGMCVSGLGPALVAVDDQMRPVHPAILYGIDARAANEIRQQTDALGADAILARCGKHLSSQAVGPKLAWLRNHVADYRPQMRWCSAHSFVVARLTGRWVLDHHTASQCDPLYDIVEQDWARDWAQELLPGTPLPDLVWPAEQVGTLHGEGAAATGLPEGLPVMAGTVDAWAEAYSVGVRRPGDLMLMYGSTMFMVQVLPAPAVDRRLWTTSGVVPGSHTLAAGMSTSGSLTTWMRELMGRPSFEALVAEAREIPAGSDGLVLLPYFAGERTPHYDPDARGVVAGLSLRHTRAHLFRATYEGIGYGIRQVVDTLSDVAGPPARVVAVGGGTQGGLWTQVVSDICGIEQVVPRVTVGASYGDALMAAVGTAVVPTGTTWAQADHLVVPDPAVRVDYDRLYQVYADLYPSTRDAMHTLSRVQADQA